MTRPQSLREKTRSGRAGDLDHPRVAQAHDLADLAAAHAGLHGSTDRRVARLAGGGVIGDDLAKLGLGLAHAASVKKS